MDCSRTKFLKRITNDAKLTTTRHTLPLFTDPDKHVHKIAQNFENSYHIVGQDLC